jgi:hypothetical protein
MKNIQLIYKIQVTDCSYIGFYNENGQLHNPSGPAIKRKRYTSWWLNGKLHREDNLPAVEWDNGEKQWYFNGYLHRDDGPAISYPNGLKEFYVFGKYVYGIFSIKSTIENVLLIEKLYYKAINCEQYHIDI